MKKKMLILLTLLIIIVGGYFLGSSQGWWDTINPQSLYNSKDNLLTYVAENYFLATIIYIGIYFISVSLNIPGATFLTLLGGFFFGPLLGTLYVNLGATSGAFVLFLAARYFLGTSIQEKYGEKLKVFNKEVDENGSSYLLMLRFIPLFPFFLINLLAGFTSVKPKTFLWTTALGIIPGSFVYAYLGYAGATIEPGESLLSPQLILALCLLALISAIPIVYKKAQKRGEKNEK